MGLMGAPGVASNLPAWFLFSVIFGISSDMWKSEHNLHHAITKRARQDPQGSYLPLWLGSWSEVLKAKIPARRHDQSTEEAGQSSPPRHSQQLDVPWLARWLVPWQHVTFLPVAVLAGRVNLYAKSLLFVLLAGTDVSAAGSRLGSNARCTTLLAAVSSCLLSWLRCAALDVIGMVLYWSWYLGLVHILSASGGSVPIAFDLPVYGPVTALQVAFVLTSHLVVGLLHVQLLVSHLDVGESFTEEEERSEQFFAFQLKTSRNLAVGGGGGSWLHGGLECHIEHHLFPLMPRHALPAVQAAVRDIARKHGIVYRCDAFWPALAGILSDLRRLAFQLIEADLMD